VFGEFGDLGPLGGEYSPSPGPVGLLGLPLR